MIINPLIIQNKYRCNTKVMKYFVYKYNLPILSISGNSYFFAITDELNKAIKNMPLLLKISSVWSK